MSSINPVGRSMNGIKTIETASLIFTDDNSSLNTSAGIVSAQANSTTALNGKINSVGFNTSNGVLTLTKEDGTTLTKDLDGRYIESLDADDIPDLPASIITSGTFGADKIPNLPASKITSGTFATERIPDLPYVSVGTAQAHTDETIFGVKTFKENLILGDDLTMTSTTETQNFTIEADATDSTTINQDAGFNSLTQKVKAGGTNRNIITQDFFSNRTTGSRNDFIQDRSETNRIVQDGASNSIIQRDGDCIISQTGTNSTITTTGKMICATAPTGGDTTMLVNKSYVDGVASGAGSFRAFSVSHRKNPASTRSVTGQSRFDPNVVVYQFPTNITMWDYQQNHHSITIAGFYSFYWGGAQFSGNTSTRLTIYKNGIYQNLTGNNTYMCGNQVSVVCHCDFGDTIQAGCEVGNMCYYAFCDTTYPEKRYNTFTGYLLQAT